MSTHTALEFVETDLDACVAAAERYAARGDNWHNHVLKPACVYNAHPGRYVLVIENNTTGEIIGHVSDHNPVDAEQHIVRLRHGAGIIGTDTDAAAIGDEPEILARIRRLVAQGADWHHHMMMPDCVLNPHPGTWLITLEADGHDDILEYSSAEEPDAVLQTIETLFFGQETKR